MGTNYYAVKKKPRIVKVYDSFHIGKSSGGWNFMFRTQPEFKTFEEFEKWILTQKEYIIKNEYERIVTPKELLKIVKNKQCEDDYIFEDNNFS